MLLDARGVHGRRGDHVGGEQASLGVIAVAVDQQAAGRLRGGNSEGLPGLDRYGRLGRQPLLEQPLDRLKG